MQSTIPTKQVKNILRGPGTVHGGNEESPRGRRDLQGHWWIVGHHMPPPNHQYYSVLLWFQFLPRSGHPHGTEKVLLELPIKFVILRRVLRDNYKPERHHFSLWRCHRKSSITSGKITEVRRSIKPRQPYRGWDFRSQDCNRRGLHGHGLPIRPKQGQIWSATQLVTQLLPHVMWLIPQDIYSCLWIVNQLEGGQEEIKCDAKRRRGLHYWVGRGRRTRHRRNEADTNRQASDMPHLWRESLCQQVTGQGRKRARKEVG